MDYKSTLPQVDHGIDVCGDEWDEEPVVYEKKFDPTSILYKVKMKEGLLVFLVGLMTITMTLTITEIKDYKKSLIPREEFVCKNGGL